MTTPPETTIPPRGRPRDVAVDGKVIDTVLQLLADGATLPELSMDGIARAAGVGKASIYRRWPSKEALLLDVVATFDVPLPEPGRRSVREDLAAALGAVREHSLAKRESALIRNAQAQIQTSPELWRRYYETLIVKRRRALARILEHGISTGEIRAELGGDLDLLVDVVAGPMLTRSIQRPDVPLEADLVDRLLDVLLEGLRPRP